MAKKQKPERENTGKSERTDAGAEAAGGETAELAPNEIKGPLEIIRDTYEMNREQLSELADAVREYAQQRPFKSVIVAAGAGVLLGVLFS